MSIMHEAARLGRLEVLESLLEEGADVNSRFSTHPDHSPWFCKLTPLMEAVRAGDRALDTLHFLSARGADLQAVSDAGGTALHYAAAVAHRPAIEFLIERGLEVNQRARGGWTPLYLQLAGLHGPSDRPRPDVDCVRALLDRGAHWRDAGGDRSTPLHAAAQNGNAACVEILIADGHPVDVEDHQGHTPLMGVAGAAAARVLLEFGADPHRRHRPFRFPSWVEGSEDEVGASSGREESAGRSAIELAIEHPSDALRAFVDAGHLPSPSEFFPCPVTWAVQHGSFGAVCALLDAGLEPIDPGDATNPLHQILYRRPGAEDQEAIVRRLVESGVDLEQRNQLGHTPFLGAVEAHRYEDAKVLLDCGARADVLHDGLTAIGFVRRTAEWQINASPEPYLAELLEAIPKREPLSKAKMLAGLGVDEEVIERIMDTAVAAVAEAEGKGADSSDGKYPLEVLIRIAEQMLKDKTETLQRAAARLAQELLEGESDPPDPIGGAFDRSPEKIRAQVEETIEFLREHGVDDEVTTEEPDHPLLRAVQQLDLAKVRELVNGRQPVNLPLRDGCRPIHSCVAAPDSPEVRAEILAVLLEAGADLEARCGWGGSSLHIAAFSGSAKIVEALLEAGANHAAYVGFGPRPLHYALWSDEVPEPLEKCRALVRFGADFRKRLPGDPTIDRGPVTLARERVDSARKAWANAGEPDSGRTVERLTEWQQVVEFLEGLGD